MQQELQVAESTAALFDGQQLWDADNASDLTPACSALFAAHATTSFTSEDVVLSVQQLCCIFSDAKLPRSSASAICCMLAAIVSGAGNAHCNVLLEVTELIGAGLGVLQAKQGADAHNMNLFLLAALHRAAVEQGCVLRMARAIVVHIPLTGLAQDGRYREMLAGWLAEDGPTVVQGILLLHAPCSLLQRARCNCR
jgi:hypothetical protein